MFPGDVEKKKKKHTKKKEVEEEGTEAPRRVCPARCIAERPADKMSARTPLPTVNERDTENVSAAV